MFDVPSWLTELIEKYRAGIAHMFLIHGNTDDLVIPGMYVKDVLLSTGLFANRSIVIRYNRSNGITFPVPAHQERFLELVGLKQQAGGALAALQQARGQTINTEVVLPSSPSQAFSLIEKVLLQTEETTEGTRPLTGLIVEHIETILPNADLAVMPPEDRTIAVTLMRWAREQDFINVGPPIILIAENINDVHQNLRRSSSRIECIKIPYPNFEERKTFISQLPNSDLAVNVERIAAQTAGLKRVHIEDIFLRADLADIKVNDELVRQRKEEIIRAEFADVLEIIEPKISFEQIGGMEYIKNYFIRNVIEPMRSGNYVKVPMGILLLGPAGTGKTVLAEAVAYESGMNCCSLNVGKLLGSYVGQSERNLERALECIEALAPTIVIVDEIDQSGLSRNNSGDSGVSNRIFRRLLEFMSDTRHRGRVLFLGISNRPDLLDPALKRPGRFDRKIPVLAPDEKEREAIIKVIAQKYNIKLQNKDLTEIIAGTDGWTGAELEALVLKAYEIANGERVTVEDLQEALNRYYPTTQDIETMTALAVAECNDLDLLPPKYREMITGRREKKETEKKSTRSRRVL